MTTVAVTVVADHWLYRSSVKKAISGLKACNAQPGQVQGIDALPDVGEADTTGEETLRLIPGEEVVREGLTISSILMGI